MSVELCHHVKCRGNRSNRCRDVSILDFLRWRLPPSGIFEILHFRGHSGQEGGTASLCQI